MAVCALETFKTHLSVLKCLLRYALHRQVFKLKGGVQCSNTAGFFTTIFLT